MDLSKINPAINGFLDELKVLGGGAAELAENTLTFIGITGPAGLKVATDIMLDVATKNITPAQAVNQFQDVIALGAAVHQAVDTIKGEQGAPAA